MSEQTKPKSKDEFRPVLGEWRNAEKFAHNQIITYKAYSHRIANTKNGQSKVISFVLTDGSIKDYWSSNQLDYIIDNSLLPASGTLKVVMGKSPKGRKQWQFFVK